MSGYFLLAFRGNYSRMCCCRDEWQDEAECRQNTGGILWLAMTAATGLQYPRGTSTSSPTTGDWCYPSLTGFLVPALFVPKTFRSKERIVPMGNFRSRDFSFPGTSVPWERKFLELSFPGPFVLGNFRSRGTKVPGNFRSLDLSFRGTFVPRTFRSQEHSLLRLFYKALDMNASSSNRRTSGH